MSNPRPTLSQLKQTCPQDLAHCEGYVWHLNTRIGKGSFGEVFLGWSSNGTKEVAVKVVRKEYFKQDPKVRENLEREIRILKLLRGSEYVVQLYHVQELRHTIVLVMELCDYDLDYLVKTDPFKEENVIVFLYQLAQGMKSLRHQNIVHRDLKPGNILIKKHDKTGKMMIKLADFGFARHFKDEGNKIIDMTSLAGTPVFMAPEALSCVFHPGEHYDDKVDIWSIGALLYKVIVGQCGFYAQLQDIPRILRHKGDAIAFERAANRKINYIYELPGSVNDRLSEAFRAKMKSLLCLMLKLDPRERMTFAEFFGNVDDIIRSKVEIVNLLQGSSFKVISDPTLTSDVLIEKIHLQWRIPSTGQVVFSGSCAHYIAPTEGISAEQFVELLNKSGGSKGHAKLYLLPIQVVQQQSNVLPDLFCMAQLKNSLSDPNTLIAKVKEDKFADELVHMLSAVGSQMRKQVQGLEELAGFSERESRQFNSTVYPSLVEQSHQTGAKLSLASQWLNSDVAFFRAKNSDTSDLVKLLALIQVQQSQLAQSLKEVREFSELTAPSLSSSLISETSITTFISGLTEQAKKLSKASHNSIPTQCKFIYEEVEKEMVRVVAAVRAQIAPVTQLLLKLWSLRGKSTGLLDTCSQVEQLLQQAAQERNKLLVSLTSADVIREGKGHAAQGNHVASPAMTPPPWPAPVGGVPGPAHTWADPVSMDKMRKDVDLLRSQLAQKEEHNRTLQAQLESLKTSSGDVEATIVASDTKHLATSSSGDLSDVVTNLTVQLKQFCTLAEASSGGGGRGVSSGSSLYPMLEGYSVINLPETPPDKELVKLLPLAKDLVSDIKLAQQPSQAQMAPPPSKESSNSALVRIARPTEYMQGDLVMFTAVRGVRSKSTLPSLLHLQQNKPFMLLNPASYNNFNIRPGRVPDIFLAKLTGNPVRKSFAENPPLAQEMGQDEKMEFYYIDAEPVVAKFSAAKSSSVSSPGGGSDGKTSRASLPKRFMQRSSGKGKDYV